MNKALYLAFGLLLCGCTSVEWTGKQFDGVEYPASGSATIYVYAPKTGMPVLGQMSSDIFLNKKAVFRIDEGFYRALNVRPGAHHLYASTDEQIACGGSINPGIRYKPLRLEVDSGVVYFVRYSSHPIVKRASTCDRHLGLVPIGEALGQLKDLREAVIFTSGSGVVP